MDIVKRAYLKVKEEMAGDYLCSTLLVQFHKRVEDEIKRLIRVKAYSGRDWPRELGPLPDELRAKKEKAEFQGVPFGEGVVATSSEGNLEFFEFEDGVLKVILPAYGFDKMSAMHMGVKPLWEFFKAHMKKWGYLKGKQ